MGDKGNERAFVFSSVTELTGEDEHESVADIEVIFGPYEDIDAHALRRCKNLQKLTLINCRLRRIPTQALVSVRVSLVHLCLSAQSISTIESLDLPQLRSLYLQQNQIERIEGLESCRRLQVCWLYGNRIRCIEGLGQCTDLRELALQDNAIQALSASENDTGLQDLVNLETLCLAKNRIWNIDELQALHKLVNLRTLVFADEHFGSNPVVRHPEYRTIAIASLRQLHSLDGTVIDDTERAGAVDQFLHQALVFNDVVADLTLRFEQELRAIETRKDRGESNAEMMQRELVEALNEVEQLVLCGTKELDEEKERQLRLRDHHTTLTVEVLKSIQQRYHQDLDRMLEEEIKELEEEETMIDVLEQEAAAEHSLSLTITTLMCAFPSIIAVERLSEHAADLQYIAAQVDADDFSNNKYHLLEVYRFYHADFAFRFENCSAQSQSPVGDGTIMHLYCAVDEDEIIGILQQGFVESEGGPASKWLALFTNPLHALELNEGALGAFGEEINGDKSHLQSTALQAKVRSHVLLVCQVLMGHVSQVTIGDATMKQLGSLNSIVSLATASLPSPSLEAGHEFVQVNLLMNQHEGEVYITNRGAGLPNIQPQLIVLCSERLVQVKAPSDLNVQPQQPESVLASFMKDVEDEVASHHDRLWKEIDPDVWVKKTQVQRDTQRLNHELSRVKDRIGEERKAQRRQLRSARLHK